jgi:hypothetical protein
MIELPMEIVKATQVVPASLILFGLPKCGKTTILSELPNNLIVDVEGGANFVDALKVSPPKDSGPVAKWKWLKELSRSIKDAGRPYDFVSIDTLSYLDEISEWVGTYNYMNNSMGKKFNRNEDGTMMKPTDPNYTSVNNLPEGYGYRWSRDAMTDIFDSLKDLGKISTIFVCHVADKYVVSKQSNQEVRVMDLSLTGKLKNIIVRDVDAVGYVWNKEGKVNIAFNGNEEKVGGMRGSKHIQGFEGPLDWNKIFLLNENK